jgi:hypothetical protein
MGIREINRRIYRTTNIEGNTHEWTREVWSKKTDKQDALGEDTSKSKALMNFDLL